MIVGLSEDAPRGLSKRKNNRGSGLQWVYLKSIIPLAALSIPPRVDPLIPLLMAAVADLLSLQDIDLELDKELARLSEIEEALGESEELTQARAVVEEKAAVVHGLRVEQKDLELSVDEVRTKAADIEKKLYSGSVKNPKELQDLDADLKSLREETKRREEKLLAILVQLDEAESDLGSATDAAAAIENEWRSGQDEMLQEKARIEPEVGRLRALRDEQATAFDRSLMSLYNTLRERRGGRAVAKVERGMCQGCRISLPMSVLQRARAGNGLVQCVSCERILLFT
jgi:predicted  nucleic acid-binding Zn-ribbon protein